mmetsp:Transcript_11911/g.11458  ORF Transcript_11911/g.11458 Transcript_11911/m.11458 type:complete len:136 (+) Transcript_11911:5386-5793(+)
MPEQEQQDDFSEVISKFVSFSLEQDDPDDYSYNSDNDVNNSDESDNDYCDSTVEEQRLYTTPDLNLYDKHKMFSGVQIINILELGNVSKAPNFVRRDRPTRKRHITSKHRKDPVASISYAEEVEVDVPKQVLLTR